MRDSRVVLVTGGTSGIGRAAVRQLALRVGRVIVVGRDAARAEQVVTEARAFGAEAVARLADLGRLADVRRLAGEVLATEPRLDVLVNDAGVYCARRELTEDGLERTFAVNHVAAHLLTNLLLPRLLAAPAGRVVTTASDAHRGGALHLDDLPLARAPWRLGFTAYARSKLANVLFTRELARRLAGTAVTATCFHPGWVATDLGKANGPLWRATLALSRPFQRTPEVAADTLVWLATSSEASGQRGGYYADRMRVAPAPAACSDADARALWDASVAITGVDATPEAARGR